MTVTPNSIVTPQTPKSACSTAALTANTTYNPPTITYGLVTAGASGARLTKLQAIPAATVTATQLQVFRSTDAGITRSFAAAALAPAYTMAQTTSPAVTDFGFSDDNPMILKAGEVVYIGVGVSGTWSFIAEWADY